MQTLPLSRRGFIANAGLAALALRCEPLLSLADISPAIVRTPLGTLRGEQSNGGLQFRGVPFAEPPVGPLRFARLSR